MGLPGAENGGQRDSRPKSRIVSRRGAFPPPPKSVRVWQVSATIDDQAESEASSPSQPAPVQPAGPFKKFFANFWLRVVLAGIIAISAWLFVSQLKLAP